MLTIKLRTMDMKEIMELWETDKKKLKIKLLDDYHILAKEYRLQCKKYTQESNQGCEIFNKHRTFEINNYQAELGIDKSIYGTIKFTEGFTENIEIALKVLDGKHHDVLALLASQLKEVIRLKALEIAEVLELLNVKVSHYKDFDKNQDAWLHEDLEELRLQQIKKREQEEQELKERAEELTGEILKEEI